MTKTFGKPGEHWIDSFNTFEAMFGSLREALVSNGDDVDVGEWHAMDVRDKPMLVSRELRDVVVCLDVPETMRQLQAQVRPNLPWAEDQFQERVCGMPLNPPPSHSWWPHAMAENETHLKDGKFSHTYPERFWPKDAGQCENCAAGRWEGEHSSQRAHQGIRFPYGDLGDVVAKLRKDPYTRQAYLAIWHPEDAYASVHGERVPCSLGYHFLMRGDLLHCTYHIRSCDLVRYFRDDWYMAARLTQWVAEQMQVEAEWTANGRGVWPGELTMHVGSLHVFQGDLPKLRREMEDD